MVSLKTIQPLETISAAAISELKNAKESNNRHNSIPSAENMVLQMHLHENKGNMGIKK